jgi:hypothetical protein
LARCDRKGRPVVFSRVFAADCKKYGIDWRIDLTHEAWEMRGDPNIDRQVRVANDSLGRERVAAIELCDPVEDDSIRDKVERVDEYPTSSSHHTSIASRGRGRTEIT